MRVKVGDEARAAAADRWAILFGIVLLNGCISRQPYPQHWSPVPAIQTCPNIEGCYKNEGDSGDVDYKPVLFDYLIHHNSFLVDPNAFTNGTAEYLEIIQLDNELVIKAYKNGSLAAQRTAQYNPEDCENGFLKIESPTSGFVACECAAGYGWEVLWLSKATDDSLVIRYDSTGCGLFFLIIPFVADVDSWSQFPVYQTWTNNNPSSQKLEPAEKTPVE